eukprot:TRINITY_DN29071_c0_g1_i1.p3 TRINITY_DN29071_c0_g1~~TRINITY_DN29071_c0_g1_i1.p3  ORF type:complete len:132 (+),score=26.94 TRINITY_DN29071_c0_g1_i1:564-959(+)
MDAARDALDRPRDDSEQKRIRNSLKVRAFLGRRATDRIEPGEAVSSDARQDPATLATARAIVREFDANGNGRLDADELHAAMSQKVLPEGDREGYTQANAAGDLHSVGGLRDGGADAAKLARLLKLRGHTT